MESVHSFLSLSLCAFLYHCQSKDLVHSSPFPKYVLLITYIFIICYHLLSLSMHLSSYTELMYSSLAITIIDTSSLHSEVY